MGLFSFTSTGEDAPWAMPTFASRVIAGLAPVVCPPELAQLGALDTIVTEVEASVRALGDSLRAGLVTGMRAYDVGAVARFGTRAHRLDPDRGRRYFETWMQIPGPTHEFAQGIKGLICMAYYELPAVKQALGYAPEQWIARVNAERHQRYGEDVRTHAQRICAPDPLPATLIPGARLRRGPLWLVPDTSADTDTDKGTR